MMNDAVFPFTAVMHRHLFKRVVVSVNVDGAELWPPGEGDTRMMMCGKR